PSQAFMVLTRAQNQPGPDGVLGTSDDVQDADNTDSPWADQSQTYASHASHQVFLREHVDNAERLPASTRRMLHGVTGGGTYPGSREDTSGMVTWAAVNEQAAARVGLKLVDGGVANVPMLATDSYGKFVPGPRALPPYVAKSGLVEGYLAAPVPVPD